MRIADIMTRDIAVVEPGDSIRRAVQIMANLSIDALPVCDGKKLVGMITERDITGDAGKAVPDPDKTKVADAMTHKVRWCFATDEVNDVIKDMSDVVESRRVPVLDRRKRLVGIVSLRDMAGEL